ncbi:MAG: DUF58 domain-containing protein [Spirochaetia bacterium]|nr:DUF58 domain-containing protein [Spirochaetia bacterium]
MKPADNDQAVATLLKRVRELELVARQNVSGHYIGQYLTSIRGTGMMFHEARKYVEGDTVRQIDWNMTARMGEPFVKIFREEREREIFIALDVSRSMHSGWQDRTKMEYAVELAATLAVSSTGAKDKLGFLTFSDRVHDVARPLGGRVQLFRALRGFLLGGALKPKSAVSDPRSAIHAIQRLTGRRFVVFIISDFVDYDVPEDLRYIKARHDVSLFHVYDPVEYDTESNVILPAYSPEGTAHYGPWRPGETGPLSTMHDFLFNECLRSRIQFASFSTRSNPGRSLTDFFQKRTLARH